MTAAGAEPAGGRPRTILVLSQVYPPDPASVGQHMADAAEALVRRGHRVVVLTADRGYDDPALRYPAREVRGGVEVIRLPLCSFGKASIAVRLLGGMSFVLQAIWRGTWLGRVGAILVSTSPPMASMAALTLSRLRGAPVTYWVMDLNPDQLVALGMIAPTALPVRVFEWLNRRILRRARRVVVLDRYMAERVQAKVDVRDKLSILPPWPHEDHLEAIPHAANPFRAAQGLEGRCVLMYSGNHGPSNPIGTMLEALVRLDGEPRLVGLFIGGGIGKREVDARRSDTIRSLPYQPLDQLRFSLSAADAHLVTVGNDIVGIVHPSKVYGALAVGRPIVLVGPARCHVADILAEARVGWRVDHGDVEGAVRVCRELLATSPEELAAMGARARALIASRFSKAELCERFCDLVDGGGRA